MKTLQNVLFLSCVLLLSTPLAHARTYTVGIIPYIPAGEFVIADVKGFYKQEGLAVNSIYYTSTGDWVRALSHNKLDFSGLWNATQMDMYYRGAKAKRLALMSYDSNDYKMIIKKGATPKSLKGKNIAVFSDYFGTHWFLQNYMSRQGLSMRDINIVEMNNQEAYKNFSIGRVDGMIFNGKYMDQALNDKTGEIAKIDHELYLAATTGGPSYFINDHPIPRKALKKFLRAWVKSMIWISKDENAAEYKQILRDAYSNSLDLVGIESDEDYTKRNPRNMLIPLKDMYRINKQTPSMFTALNNIHKDIGYPNSKPYKPKDMFDNSLILEVLEEFNLHNE
ncbi:MAG: ABC transporter substrate-binding protein [Gammaproteobacteria bacterium]|nr:ABC transporter substrate-binding protein [Gammaproteobacteria bacterium]